MKRNTKKAQPRAVIAIGASAGGLESFTTILAALKPDLGFAYVIIQHLDPEHPSFLADLLGKATSLPVEAVEGRVKACANHVYVAPSESSLEWDQGFLVATKKHIGSKREHYTIDRFFRSLRKAKGPLVGILLSGSNSDGTLGLKSLKKIGALTLTIPPGSTEFSVMPTSAIHAKVVDGVMPVPEIGAFLNKLDPRKIKVIRQNLMESRAHHAGSFDPIFKILQDRTGVDFAHYKLPTLQRRIHRRMALLKQSSVEAYASHLTSHNNEVKKLFEEITIHVTEFFRDPRVFVRLKNKVLPDLIKRLAPGAPLRIWIVGCATGQEAYSVAMLAAEAFRSLKMPMRLQLFATDISENSIQQARAGFYSEDAMDGIPESLLHRYFSRVRGGYQVQKELRKTCVFARQDITADPPLSKMDLVCCRNVLIYLTASSQKRALGTIGLSLQPRGCLVLGSAESTGNGEKSFQCLDRKTRIFQKNARAESKPAPALREKKSAPTEFAPAPKANFSLPDIPHPPYADFKIPLMPPKQSNPKKAEALLTRELKKTRSQFKDVLENQNSLYEELGATHQAVLASNEELQIKNEELETVQEELQAANEELRTVNDEMLERNAELDRLNAVLESSAAQLKEAEAYSTAIVETVREPLLILDKNLKVASANQSFYRFFEVDPAQTIGRPVYDLGNRQWDIAPLRRLLEEIIPQRSAMNDFEVKHVFPRIGPKVMALNARQIRLEKAGQEFILLALEDVSERSRQSQRIRESHERVEHERDESRTDAAELRLEKALREKFVAALTHDLRTPLSSAKLSVQLLLRKMEPNESNLRNANRILNSLVRADRMITDLLDANRITAGQPVHLNLEDTELKPAIELILQELQALHGERLEFGLPIGSARASIDSSALRRILENLVGNAFKYGLPGETVLVQASLEDGWARISVHNEGLPISPDDQRHLFDQFHRTHESSMGGKEGWGLGLTLVKGFVEAMQGRVLVESGEAMGTRFTVSFPLSH